AQIARMQEARAERRFNDVRSLANSLLFDVYDSIQDLPGSTPARRIVADRALHYLDTLSQESAGSPDLERELATAYERVGDVQANPFFANLGDTAGAIQSYRKALRIRLDLAGDHPSAFPDQAALVATYMNLGLALENNLDFAAAMDAYRKAYAIATTWAVDRKDDPQAQETLAGVCFSLAILLADQGDVPGSLNYYRKSAAIREAIRGGSQAFRNQVQTRLAGVYGYMAGDLALQGDPASAIALQSKTQAILTAQVAADPQNSQLREFLLQSEYWIAKYSEQMGDYRQAISNYREAFAGYQKLSAADPRDALAMRYLGLCELGVGTRSPLWEMWSRASSMGGGPSKSLPPWPLPAVEVPPSAFSPLPTPNRRSAMTSSVWLRGPLPPHLKSLPTGAQPATGFSRASISCRRSNNGICSRRLISQSPIESPMKLQIAMTILEDLCASDARAEQPDQDIRTIICAWCQRSATSADFGY